MREEKKNDVFPPIPSSFFLYLLFFYFKKGLGLYKCLNEAKD